MISSTSGKRVQRTRKRILDAAGEHFLKDRYSGTSMDDISATAGVSKQTVYAHFGSKEALFIEVIRSMTGQAGDQLLDEVADPQGDRPMAEFLLDFAVSQLAIVLTPRLMQLRRLVIAEVDKFPQLGKALHDRGPQRSIDRMSLAFSRYIEAGEMSARDPRVAASFFNWLVMGAPVNAAMLMGDDAIPDAPALRAHAEESVRIFLAAYGGAAPSGTSAE